MKCYLRRIVLKILCNYTRDSFTFPQSRGRNIFPRKKFLINFLKMLVFQSFHDYINHLDKRGGPKKKKKKKSQKKLENSLNRIIIKTI